MTTSASDGNGTKVSMIGIDTNILVRLLTQDDPTRMHAARAFFAERNARDPAYVSAIVLARASVAPAQADDCTRQRSCELALAACSPATTFDLEHAERLGELLDTRRQQAGRTRGLSDRLVGRQARVQPYGDLRSSSAQTAVHGMELIP